MHAHIIPSIYRGHLINALTLETFFKGMKVFILKRCVCTWFIDSPVTGVGPKIVNPWEKFSTVTYTIDRLTTKLALTEKTENLFIPEVDLFSPIEVLL